MVHVNMRPLSCAGWILRTERLLLPVLRQPITLPSPSHLYRSPLQGRPHSVAPPSFAAEFCSLQHDMRKHSLLNVAGYGLAIALSCLPGAWSAPHNTTRNGFAKSPRGSVTKRAITVDPATCVGTWRSSVNTALVEAKNMVKPCSRFLARIFI